ncbi:DNRLRE domain-containing protein [Modestobacter sp. SYSU DS0511]
MTILQGAPAQAAPAQRTSPLPESAVEGTSDDRVPVPSKAVPAPAMDELSVQPPPVEKLPHVDMPEMPEEFAPNVEAALEEAAALLEAAETGDPIEIASATTESTIKHAMPDGTVRVEASAGPVRVEVDGEWLALDTTLEFTEDGARPKATTADLAFADGAPGSTMVTFGDGEGSLLRLDWREKLPKPELDGSSATYRNVMPQVDLVLTATRQGFTQHLVVQQRPSESTFRALDELVFPVETAGAELVEAGEGRLELVDGHDDVVATTAPAVMWDSRTESSTGGPLVMRSVDVQVADESLLLRPDSAFLRHPETVYPVTIDPAGQLGLFEDTYVQSNIRIDQQFLKPDLLVGAAPNSGGQVNRSLLRFWVDEAEHRVVTSATLALWENWSSSCSPRWVDIREAGWFDPKAVTWPGPALGALVGNANVAKGYGPGCPAGWVISISRTGCATSPISPTTRVTPWRWPSWRAMSLIRLAGKSSTPQMRRTTRRSSTSVTTGTVISTGVT